jgi:hypothetical protein
MGILRAVVFAFFFFFFAVFAYGGVLCIYCMRCIHVCMHVCMHVWRLFYLLALSVVSLSAAVWLRWLSIHCTAISYPTFILIFMQPLVHRPPSTVHRPPSTVHRSPSTCTPTTPTTHRTPHTKGQPSVVFISSHAGFRKRGCKNRLDIALKHRDLTAQSRRKFQSHAAPPWKVFFAIYVEGADRKEMKERAKSNLLVLDRFSTLSMLFQTLCTIAESVCLFWACLLLTKTVEMFGGS